MSFKCYSCHQAQPDRTMPIRVVLEWRAKRYPAREEGGVIIDKGGRGLEIAREVDMCAKCAERHV